MKIKNFKIRASAAHQLLTGRIEIDQKGLNRIAELQREKETLVNANGNKVKWTDNKQAELDKLLHLKANPSLGKGTMTCLEEWFLTQIDGVSKKVKSKYLDKGNVREPEALARMAKWFGLAELPKNETYYEDDFFTGMPDTPVFIHNGIKTIADAKCADSKFTMPYFVPIDPQYKTQVIVYLHQTGAEQGYVCHCLEQPLDKQVERECYDRGYEEITETVWNEVLSDIGFDHLADEMRIVAFGVTPEPETIHILQRAVLDCRQALNELIIPAFNAKTGLNVEMEN